MDADLLEKMECWCFADGTDGRAGLIMRELLRLKSQLEDPNYMYAGGRIHRHAILTRNGQIDALRQEIKSLRAQIAQGPA